MGQAKKRGSRDERVAQALANPSSAGRQGLGGLKVLKASDVTRLFATMDRLLAVLTTPAEIDQDVLDFARRVDGQQPLRLQCEPLPWSRQDCCELNVEEYIRSHGGQKLVGYKIWQTAAEYVEGERHVVWTDGATVRDVSFCSSGEQEIVFVPDGKPYDAAPAKVRHAVRPGDTWALQAYEALESKIPVRPLSAQEAWASMPSYDEFMSGKRIPSAFDARDKAKYVQEQ
ncbi:hypothetical protein [Herbaspirillum huttiense]|uniref:hypothetical protein n=1 Tax=Herbaspirillum huttiense TaxID=863372 RepID=UPI0039B11DD4